MVLGESRAAKSVVSPTTSTAPPATAPTTVSVNTSTNTAVVAANAGGRRHITGSKYQQKRNFKEFLKKRNEYDEKFVAEMSVSEKDADDNKAASAAPSTFTSFEDASSFERDDSSQFEADLSCELTEFEKEILSKYLKEYRDEGDDDATKCEEIEELAMVPTTIMTMFDTKDTAASDGYASSYNSDDLIQEDLAHDETYVTSCQIGTKITCKNSFDSSQPPSTITSRTISSSTTSSCSASTHHHHLRRHHHHHHHHDLNSSSHHKPGGKCDNNNKLAPSLESTINNNTHDINNNSNDQSSNNFNNNNSASRPETRSSNRNNNNNNDEINDRNNNNNRNNVNLQNPRNRQLRQNFPIWVGITSCVWGLFIYLMREMQ